MVQYYKDIFWRTGMLTLYLLAIEDHSNDHKFISLYERYEKKVFSIAYKYMGNIHDAEDASQSAFFALARNIDKINIEDEVATKVYVYKTVKNACLDILRKRQRQVVTISLDNCYGLRSDDDPNDDIIADELLQKLLKAIEGMSAQYREILSFHYVCGYSAKEISVILQKPLSTIKSRLNRGSDILISIIKGAADND